MQIEIDKSSGFCFGVKRAVELAEQALANREPVYCLGEIVHNEEEIKRLESKGLSYIKHSDLQKIKNSKILIRAHGEPPSTFGDIKANNNNLTDGTCPIVLHLQKKVKKAWEEMKLQGGQIVIYGKKGHAEVNGLAGYTNEEAVVISGSEDLKNLDLSKPLTLFAQTTMDYSKYVAISEEIRAGMQKKMRTNNIPLYLHNTICGHVSNRGEKLKKFSTKYDIIIFVSGLNSSNGKILYNICKETNHNTYWVADVESLKKEWFKNAKKVGICGATSTPMWLMEDIAKMITELTKN